MDQTLSLSRWKTVLLAIGLAGVYFSWGLLFSIPPPFYPQEAERKGATPAQYGLVFGMMHLAAFLFAPFFGAYGTQIGPKLLFIFGGLLQSLSGALFGLLEYVDDTTTFLALSYVLRFLSGLGDAASWGAILGMLMTFFPQRIGSIVAFCETFFGLGYVVGPAVGSLLYTYGGFGVPFYVTGIIGLIFAIWLLFFSREISGERAYEDLDSNTKSEEEEEGAKGSMLTVMNVLKSPLISLPFLDVTVTLMCVGLLEGMLTEHLVDLFSASTGEAGASFVVLGTTYVLAMPIAGLICDRFGLASPLCVVANLVLVAGLLLIGPAPFLPVQSSLGLTYGMCSLVGFAYGIVGVATMSRASRAAKAKGFEESMQTYLMVTGLYACSFYLGNFIGPSLAGIMVELMSFEQTATIFAIFPFIMAVLDGLEMIFLAKCPN